MDSISMYITAEGAAKLKIYIYNYNVVGSQKGICNRELHSAVSDLRRELMMPVYDFKKPETVKSTPYNLKLIEKSLDWLRESLPVQVTEYINYLVSKYGK